MARVLQLLLLGGGQAGLSRLGGWPLLKYTIHVKLLPEKSLGRAQRILGGFASLW